MMARHIGTMFLLSILAVPLMSCHVKSQSAQAGEPVTFDKLTVDLGKGP